jgi:acylphosphatase
MEEATRHYLISGRVQGVGYRAFAERTARQLKLCGWVRNLEDGRVEALACGPEKTLQEFAAHLQRGPARAQVDALVVSEVRGDDIGPEFSVREDGSLPCFVK